MRSIGRIRLVVALVSALSLGAVGGTVMAANGDTPPGPPPDTGAGVFVTGGPDALAAIREVLCRQDTPRVAVFNTPPLVSRDVYPAWVTNANSPGVLNALGNPSGAPTVLVKSTSTPEAQARKMVADFASQRVNGRPVIARAISGAVAGDDPRDLWFVGVPEEVLAAKMVVVRRPVGEFVGPRPEPAAPHYCGAPLAG